MLKFINMIIYMMPSPYIVVKYLSRLTGNLPALIIYMIDLHARIASCACVMSCQTM